jgi:hypothetical protein
VTRALSDRLTADEGVQDNAAQPLFRTQRMLLDDFGCGRGSGSRCRVLERSADHGRDAQEAPRAALPLAQQIPPGREAPDADHASLPPTPLASDAIEVNPLPAPASERSPLPTAHHPHGRAARNGAAGRG